MVDGFGRLKVGIAGCGLIGSRRAQSVLVSDELIGVFYSDQNAADMVAQDFEVPVYSSYAGLLAAKPDVVIIATTHDSLAQCAIDALEAGCDVLVEKPAGRTTADVLALQAVAREQGRMVCVGFNHRFHPGIADAVRLALGGEFGDVMFVRARYGHGGRVGYDTEWRADPMVSGGGELIDQGFHLLDLTRCLLGELPVKSTQVSTVFWNMPVDDNAIMVLGSETPSAPFAVLHASCSEWKNLFDFEIYCRTAKLHITGLQGSYGQQKLTVYRMKPEMGPPDVEEFSYPLGDASWGNEWEAVRESVLRRRPVGGDLESALYCHRVADAAYGAVEWR
jgi:predicted dehydrogenase